ncbi:MAG: HAMP domain-containing histidine kinase [Patescibacteria group bacterium]|nr:HAMP domain-containing histidine kinase [Patescibacteria group bacterium]
MPTSNEGHSPRRQFDIFSSARLKIILLFLIMGAAVVAVAEYFLYGPILTVIGGVFRAVQALLAQQKPITTGIVQILVLQAIGGEIQKLDWRILVAAIAALFLLAYFLAGITLEPIRRILNRQRRFASHVSHELRTPLSVMKTNSEAAFLGDAPPNRPELIDILQSTLEETDRMTEVIEFFFASSAWNDRRQFELSPIDLGAIVRKTAKFMKVKAIERGLNLIGPAEEVFVSISGNNVLLEGMLINLLKNAIAYTPSGGSIQMIITVGRQHATVSVSDTGIGIPEKDLPNIFKAFYRGENAFSQQTKRKGSGIGLTIVKEIADLHHAKIEVTSELGKGTAISIIFPRIS